VKVENAKIHISCGAYQFIEATLLDVTDLTQILEIAADFKKREQEAKFKCEHPFRQSFVSKAGQKCEECECGGIRFMEKDGTWSTWRWKDNGK
jgi:hypothetical protein